MDIANDLTAGLRRQVLLRAAQEEEGWITTDPEHAEQHRYTAEKLRRLADEQFPAPLKQEYEEVLLPPEDWPWHLDEEYGEQVICCDGKLLTATKKGALQGMEYMIHCRAQFSGNTVSGLLQEISRHLESTVHYQGKK
jgi:hypothetical protein